MRFSAGELLEKLGVWTDTTGPDPFAAGDLALHRTRTEAEQARAEAWTAEIYQGFVDKVAACRGFESGAWCDEHLARGRVFYGDAAAENGLVDSVGGLEEALEVAAGLAGIAESSTYRRELVRVGKATPLEVMLGGKRAVDIFHLMHHGGGGGMAAASAASAVAGMVGGSGGAEVAATLQGLELALEGGRQYGGAGATAPMAILPAALGLGGIGSCM